MPKYSGQAENGRVYRLGTVAVGLGWQGELTRHQQTRGHVFAHAADSWCTLCACAREGVRVMGQTDSQAPRTKRGDRCAGQQDGQHDLGRARA